MAKLLDLGDGRLEYRTSGRGLGVTALLVGAVMIGISVWGAGSPARWNVGPWVVCSFGVVLALGGAYLTRRGSLVWTFDRNRSEVLPPRGSRTPAFPLAEVLAVVLTTPRRLGPSILLLSCLGERSHTLEVVGALERSAARLQAQQLAGFLGVPFDDQGGPGPVTPLPR
jgi:hypothetical protein